MGKQKNLIIPEYYKSRLSVRKTEKMIKTVKDYFERELAAALNLARVSAPLFVRPESGLNDNLNGIEKPVSFKVKAADNNFVEIVQSLAKWKRMALKKYKFKTGEGIYTDMNAIRKDEELDNLHSIYVDQWDWELVISKEERNILKLREIVQKIFEAFKKTENYICEKCGFEKLLPDEIFFITTQELENMYPELTPGERENKIARKKKAVFLMQIGSVLKSGIKHDGRAPDYDDWKLNGDIIFWYPLFDKAFEISSMGIRVDEESLEKQLSISGCEERKKMKFHRDLLKGNLPYTAGGGIGQSRLCMFLLRKAHVGEVQSSVWPEEMIEICKKAKINLL